MPSKQIIVDPIHGDIHLTDDEWRLINTATFQRLRYIKQLAMGHFVYPNATHTRFIHSRGVLAIMKKVLDVAERKRPPFSQFVLEKKAELCLAALLHDVGHYPYSHLMEKLDKVVLAEEFVDDKRRKIYTPNPYPQHENLGKDIVTSQEDVLDIVGGETRAREIGDLFSRGPSVEPQLCKFINSSLDMDRLDYLLRDSHAAGVPYGHIDCNYLLNSLNISDEGIVGISAKALPAAEQFLMARYFMYQTVYYHKTKVGLEEACKQLLRRLRDRGQDGVPKDGAEVVSIVTSNRLRNFDDTFVDGIVRRVADDPDEIVKGLARTVLHRRPPKLLREVGFVEGQSVDSSSSRTATAFKASCKHGLQALAEKFGLPVGLFIFHETGKLTLEKRGHLLTRQAAKEEPSEREDPMIKVFLDGQDQPVSIVDVPHSLLSAIAGCSFELYRLYVVQNENCTEEIVKSLREEVTRWVEDA